MGMKKEEIIEMIVKSLPDAQVEVKDLAGDDNHYAAPVTSCLFEGKMGGVLHALSLTTLTPKN